jgi:serine phosphatase RsbU (regulator of sigma subunit)
MSVQTPAPAPTPSQPYPIPTGPKRRSHALPASVWLLWTAGVGALLLILLSLSYCLAFLPALLSAGEPGFRWGYNTHTRTMVVTAVEPGSAAAAGLRVGMLIRAINGREPSPSIDTWGPPGHRVLRPGEPLTLVVTSGDKTRQLTWRVEKRPWYRVNMAAGGWTLGADQLFHACFLAAALVTVGLGALVLARKPHLPAARAFAGFCWALAVANHTAVIAHAPDESVPPWLLHTVFANDGWSRLALAAALLFFALFPEPKAFYRRRPGWVVALLFGPATLLLLIHGALAHSAWRFRPLAGSPGRLAALRALDAWDWWAYTVPCASILIAMLIFSITRYAGTRTAGSAAARRQMRSLVLAAVPLLLFALVTTSFYLIRGSVGVSVSMAAPLLFLALPLTLGYSILTQGIFDLGRAVRGGLAYTGAMSLVMVSAFGVAGLLGQQVVRSFGPTATGWALAAGALLAHPLLGGAQRWLNRRFGRDSQAALQQAETLSHELALVLDADPLASILTERVPALLGVRRAVLYSRVGSTLEFVPLRGAGLELPRRPLRAPDSGLPALLCRGELVPIYLPGEDAARLALSPQDVQWLEETELVLWLPLTVRGETRLALALGWKNGEDVYTREELAVLRVLASQAAAGWENARLARDRTAAARVEQELSIGREIQAQLLPTAPVELGEFRIDAHSEPATEVGGDFYNFFPVGGGRWAVLLGDVAGKGIPGALCMAVISSLVEGLSETAPAGGHVSPAELLARANTRAHPKLRPLRMFATALIVLIDTAEGTITLANAGQTPPILWRAGHDPEFLRIGGLPLGARPQTSYTEERLSLQAGDVWILATDGLLDQADPAGYPNLLRRLREGSRRSPQTIIETLFTIGEDVERDDRTVVLVSRRAFMDGG